jgi:hypothetical protein
MVPMMNEEPILQRDLDEHYARLAERDLATQAAVRRSVLVLARAHQTLDLARQPLLREKLSRGKPRPVLS